MVHINNSYCPGKSKEIKDIIKVLATHLEDYHLLFRYTHELKTMLTKGCAEDFLENIIKERGLLIDKLVASKKYFDSLKEFPDIVDNSEWKLQTNELLQKIRQLLDATVSLDAENVFLMKQCIKDITLNLEKIKEGKYFISNLGKHINNTPFFVDVCG
ncbi:MAG: hypothetical protein DYG83_13630 [Candidatus Brocadia sp. AMX2]|uniref:Uncharacterized protein n=1 Tax=Candidatus Brocadia sinica JPN1 TaxID=1197129 RepID=A0ABQ0K1T8_9BACT|nr:MULTISPECIES: hypothetical protein [Brocadia]KXK27749.1 MAG: hypothetical protein UZ01_03036 [Candidatus Brocadia sinica]MBC6932083.1 hypothetical protein [Candidatus Brocadia sp.]MBL1168774.1 hypothetical protein [Candidatus Brocadia sp. AMX1]NOG42833.1 hypothetical protein [Planctomycetota bacterium]KAA0244531.1 MAG: hypothetical protein EDM70_06310 [Candidatus Brocadia sp. AMX2]